MFKKKEWKVGRMEGVGGICAFYCLNCDLWDSGIFRIRDWLFACECRSHLGEHAVNLGFDGLRGFCGSGLSAQRLCAAYSGYIGVTNPSYKRKETLDAKNFTHPAHNQYEREDFRGS